MKFCQNIFKVVGSSLSKKFGRIGKPVLWEKKLCPSEFTCLSTYSTQTKKKMSDFILPNDTPVVALDCQTAFDALTEQEKLYAHYLSRASWYGGLIVLHQTSLESPLIFTLLRKVFREESFNDLKQRAISECNFTEDEYQALLVYTTGIFSNMGNYKGFGDTKFIPNLPQDKFEKLIKTSLAMRSETKQMEHLLANTLDSIFSLKDNDKQLGFPYKGTTTYLSKNFLKEDAEIVSEFFKKQKFNAENSRLFKTVDETGECCYEVRLASILSTDDVQDKEVLSSHTMNGHKFIITRGDYSKLLKLTNKELQTAKEYASNENEIKMVENYVQSFETGSLESHKNGSRHWIKNKGPIIETYIGFIETYRDPAGLRGEFEGFVAMVNKPMSVKLCELVRRAEEFLPSLPWPNTYEKDKFLQPDFTSLDILTFAVSGIPIGINIPNYDDIRQNEGFKNVTLGNVMSGQLRSISVNYLSKADEEIIQKHLMAALELCVSLHELLGHGSGKLFMKQKDGSMNFDIDQVVDLETNEKISKWYEVGETYNSVFSSLASAAEECRAECVGLYLSTLPEILRLFGYEDEEAENVMYTVWLEMGLKGLEGLQMYEPKTESWLQAHAQGRYSILRVMLEAGDDFVKVEKTTGADGKPDLLYTMDRTKIMSVGMPAIGDFLRKIQFYKATANFEKAKSMFDKYSAVTSEDRYPFLNYREIVMARRKPRKVLVQTNTVLKDGKVTLKNYDASHEGMIQSWLDRLQDDKLDDILIELWAKDKHHF